MSNPHRDRVNAKLEAALRPFAEEAIPGADVDLLALIRKVVTDSGMVRVERLSGPIPPNAIGVVQEASVQVSHPAFSTTASLATLLDQIIAGLAAGSIGVAEGDGSPSGAARTLVFPNGTLSLDLGAQRATIAIPVIDVLDDIGDVAASSPSDGDRLTWDAGASAWIAAAPAIGRYRQYVVVSDGAGGFSFIDDGTGHPVESLEALE
jgi:hypothetical protein